MLQLLGSEMKTRMEMVVRGWGGEKKDSSLLALC